MRHIWLLFFVNKPAYFFERTPSLLAPRKAMQVLAFQQKISVLKSKKPRRVSSPGFSKKRPARVGDLP
ncbi:hypothetical protein ACO0LN_16500 [Undibacterium sp. TC9W]